LLKLDELKLLRDALTEPVIFGDLILHKLLHSEYPPQPAGAIDANLIKRPEGLILEDLHEGEDIDGHEQPNSLLQAIHRVSEGEVLDLLLSLRGRYIDPPLDAGDIGQGQLERPGKAYRDKDMED
jgi:hypothetical protein